MLLYGPSRGDRWRASLGGGGGGVGGVGVGAKPSFV